MADVARGINDKLVRRHPHVFARGDASESSADDLVADWERIKRAEKEAKGVSTGPFDGIPSASGALSYAAAVLKRAEKAGQGQDIEPIDRSSVDDMGRFLLAVVAECRRRGVDPEVELRRVANDIRAAVDAQSTTNQKP